MWGMGVPNSLVLGLQTGPDIVEMSVKNSQKAKHKFTIWSSYTSPWHVSKGLDILFPDTCSGTFIAALFTIAMKW